MAAEAVESPEKVSAGRGDANSWRMIFASRFNLLRVILWGIAGWLLMTLLKPVLVEPGYAPRLKATSAGIVVQELVKGVNAYYSEYARLPRISGLEELDTGSPSGVALLDLLVGDGQPSGRWAGPFLHVKESRNRRDGLKFQDGTQRIEGLYDPWGKPYEVWLDTDDDGIVKVDGGLEVKGLVAARSCGEDGKPGTADDIRSW